MKIVVDGRRVSNYAEACYDEYVAYFTKRGLDKGNALHEYFHHLVYVNELDLTESKEEREANRYAKIVLNSSNCID